MGLGREVGDAYISVHGDLSDFRDDLNKANNTMKEWAEDGAKSATEAWGDRMQSDWSKQWNSVLNSMYSGTKLDFNRMITAFDPSDMDAAVGKIEEMLSTMEELGKINDVEHTRMISAIGKEVKARQDAFAAQKEHAQLQRGWDEAHLQMMEGLAALRKNDSDQALSDFSRMQAAQENYNKSFEAMFRANRFSDLTADFSKLTRAMGDMDFSKFAAGFDDFDAARQRVVEVTQAMNEMGRISDDNADRMIAGIDAYITAETDRRNIILANEEAIQKAKEEAAKFAEAEALRQSQANGRALREATALREEQERFNRSFEGLGKIASAQKLEQDFRNLAAAVQSNDWSTFSRGIRNTSELRNRVREVSDEMSRLGRIGSRGLSEIENALDGAVRNMRAANITFDEGTRKVSNFRGAITRGTTALGRMFALTRGFREHLGGFAGINVFDDMIRKGLDFVHNLDRIALSSALTTAKLSTMASVGGAGLSSMITIAGDLIAILGGLAAVAPAFLVGAGIGIGVMIAAFKDMKKVLKDLTPAFAKLQDNISAKFWAEAAGPIRSLVKEMMPLISAKTGATAAALGGVFASLANAIKAIPADAIGTMFDRMNSAIAILGRAMSPLISAFTALGMVGSEYFERFATWLVKLSEQFNTFITAAAADGRLNGWIDEMIVQFANLGRAIDGIFGIFNALDAAATAAGFGGLKTFADNMQGLAAAMQSAGAQTALTQLLSGMLIFVTKIGEALGNLGSPLASIMPTINLALSAVGGAVAQVIGYIGEIMANPTVQQGITDFTNGIALAVAALAPAVTPFAESLGTVMSLLGLILVNVAAIASAFMVQLGPVLDQMSAQFETLVAPLGDAVLNLITAITPVAQAINDSLVGPLVSGIRDQIIPGFNLMVATLSPVATQMVTALGPVLQALLPLIPPIMQLATTIGGLLMQAVTAVAPLFVTLVGAIMPIVDAIMQLVNMIAPFLIPAIEKISAALQPVITVIGQVVGVILSVLVPVLGFLLIGIINNVVGVFQGLSNFIMGFVEIVTAIFTGFGAFFTKLFQGDFIGALQALGDMFKNIWDGVVKMLQGALEFLWNAVQLLFIGKLIGGIKSGLSAIVNFFKSSWDNVGGTVGGALNAVLGFITNGLNAAKNFVSDALLRMLNFFMSGWSNMVSATSTGIGNVLSWVGGIPGKISGALSGLGNLLVNAGKAIIDGLLQGLKNAWGAVTSFVGGIADWIAKNKGPIPYDRKLLVPAGEAIMQGLGAGLKGQMSNLLETLHAITGGVTDAVTEAFARSRMYVAGANAALGLADGLDSKKSRVLGSLGALTPDATLSAKVSAVGSGGVGNPTPPAGNSIVFEEGAIALHTNTQSPQIAADMILDGLVSIIT